MSNRQMIYIAIISAILTGIFMYLVYYFPYELVNCLLWFMSVVVCFMSIYLIIALI